jgi:hypothetical protein
MNTITRRRKALFLNCSIEKHKKTNCISGNAGQFALQASSDPAVNTGARIMSHHYHLPPESDLAVRSWIKRHKRALRLGFFAFVLLAIPVVVGLVWAVVSGASYLKNYTATKAMEWVPVQWEMKLGDIAGLQATPVSSNKNQNYGQTTTATTASKL